MRERLEDTREGVTQKFKIIARAEDGSGTYEIKGFVQTGEFADGRRLGEVFVKIGKPGGSNAVYDGWATASSIALQHGAPVEELMQKFIGTRFEPSGAVQGVAGILRCTSPLDLMARWILQKYGKKES
jgi:ribonucleoside-diphosphate reductase alpha chain